MFAWLRSLFAPKTPAPDLSQAPDEPAPSERAPSTRPSNQQGWIGVDLDGTLAEATPWQGMSHIGPPVPLMMRRVRHMERRAIDRLGFVQADPLRAPARAQDLTLRHRVLDYRAGDLVKMSILVNAEPVDALSMLVHRTRAAMRGAHA
mgnify:CR=1 FL=1